MTQRAFNCFLRAVVLIAFCISGKANAQVEQNPVKRDAVKLSDARKREALSMMAVAESELDAILAKLDSAEPPNGKERYDAEARATHEYFTKRFPAGSDDLGLLIDGVMLSEDEGFARIALSEIIDALAIDEKRDVLVDVLSQRCPKRVYIHTSIEAFLVIIRNDELHDGVLVMCDAYERSRDKGVRRTLSTAMRHGLAFTGIHEVDDDDFVSKCRGWYMHNHAKYEPNLNYLEHLIVDQFPYEKHGVLRPLASNDASSVGRQNDVPPKSE